MEQLSRAKLLVRRYCRFHGNLSGGFRLRNLDRCSLVDFWKPRSIPLKSVGSRSQRHALGKAEIEEAYGLRRPAPVRVAAGLFLLEENPPAWENSGSRNRASVIGLNGDANQKTNFPRTTECRPGQKKNALTGGFRARVFHKMMRYRVLLDDTTVHRRREHRNQRPPRRDPPIAFPSSICSC
jgi:hypothetical protein